MPLKNGYKNYEEFIKKIDIVTKSKSGIFATKKQMSLLLDQKTIIHCMISRLEIYLGMGNLLACPYCKNIAKEELLEKWLERKGTCPICKKRLELEECLTVLLKK
ncbi:MAG: hypothetical protein GF308_10945 [Candidatus Heimdallarchaeota archaeon]|nr:hypothetical protein [Candidatus Heimdallarchaeota archaeon]